MKNQNSNELEQYMLNQIKNYNSKIGNTRPEILTKLNYAIIEYLRFITEKIVIKNIFFYRFILERGLDTLIHVFFFIFYYTKNLDMSFYHTQKAYYFYIEYIEQITNDNVTFLQLSSRDATLFVYKKTIFEINNEIKKSIHKLTNEEANILNESKVYANIYKNIISFIINHKNIICEEKIKYMDYCCDKIKEVCELLDKSKIKTIYIDYIYTFTIIFINKDIEIETFFSLIHKFIHCLIKKKKINENNITINIYNLFSNLEIYNNDIDKTINNIFVE
jgi:hypothetical protein